MLWEKIMKWGWDYNRGLRINDDEGITSLLVEDNSPNMEKSIRFAVLPARGGCVMETRVFNAKDREWDTVSHIIPEGADVAESVGKIVAMELLRH